MNRIEEALEALDRIDYYCEEKDLNIPENERTGYKMSPDIFIIWDALYKLKKEKKQIIKTLEKYKNANPMDGKDDYYRGVSVGYYCAIKIVKEGGEEWN